MNCSKKIGWFIPFILWFCISLWALTLPGTAIPTFDWFDTIEGDKWAHIGIFFLLCSLLYLGFIKSNTSPKNLLWLKYIIAIIFFIYGVVIEFIQRDFIMYRSFDVYDIIADGVGCILAILLFGITQKLIHKYL